MRVTVNGVRYAISFHHDREVRKERLRGKTFCMVRRREISSMGGQAAHDLGRAHEWKPGEQAARDAGRKGGTISRGGRGRRKPEGGTAGVGVMGLLIALAVIEMALLLVLSLDTLVHDPTWASVGQVGTLILIAIVVVIAWRRSGAIIEWSDRHGIRW